MWTTVAVAALAAGAVLKLSPALRRMVWSKLVFPFMYMMYVNTPVGKLVHSRELAAAREKGPHSRVDLSSAVDCGSFVVVTVPFLSDNYAYIVLDLVTGISAVVDPADAEAVAEVLASIVSGHEAGSLSGALARMQTAPRLQFILTTHKHLDHSGGNIDLCAKLPGLTVVGGLGESVPGVTREYDHAATIELGSTHVTVLGTPCHTRASVAYFLRPSGSPSADSPSALFSGDTLFTGGVGKFFEGSANQMLGSLQRLTGLPKQTLMFPGHEMTVSNLEFAVFVEPSNQVTSAKLEWAKTRRQANLPTVPSSLEEELSYNPFLRLESPEALRLCGIADPSAPLTRDRLVSVLAKLRKAKDDNVHVPPS